MAETPHPRHQIHYLRTLSGVVGMIRNPEGTESVFDIEDGLRHAGAMDSFQARVSGLPGVGKLIIDSIAVLDRPVMVAYLILVAFLFVTINFVIDLVFAVIDPRIRHGEG